MKFTARAYHINDRINLEKARDQFEFRLIKSEFTFLLFQLSEISFVYMKDYGSIAFFNVEEVLQEEVLNSLGRDLSEPQAKEEFIVQESGQGTKVAFNDICLHEITTDSVHIILLNLSQSVAIEYYLNKSSELLDETKKYTLELEAEGRISLGRKKMRMFIGHTLNFKNRIAENLFIFDAPSLAWTQKDLSDLDNQLKEELDIVNRHYALQNNLKVVSENLDLFKDILQHKHSSTLEWIIIILILFEVIHVLIK